MSISAISAALRATTTPTGEQLATTKIVTLHALATFTNEETHECYPSLETLMRHTGLSKNAIRGAFRDLESYGWLTRHHRTARTTVYRLDIDAIIDANRRERAPKAQASKPVAPQAPAPVKAEAVEVEIVPSPIEAVEAPQGHEDTREATITQETPESPAEAPSEPVQGEPVPAPAPKKARKGSRAAEIPGLEADFIDFYMTYPRHVGRGTALRAYEKARRGGASASEILDGARRYAEAAAAAGTEIRYIKHPSTWLSAQCWLDDMDAAAPRELTPTQRKVRRLAQSLQSLQDAQGLPQTIGTQQATRELTSTQQAPVQAPGELTYSPAGQAAPMGAQDAAPADDPWPNVKWTRTKYGIPQIV